MLKHKRCIDEVYWTYIETFPVVNQLQSEFAKMLLFHFKIILFRELLPYVRWTDCVFRNKEQLIQPREFFSLQSGLELYVDIMTML